ncbi:MAG: hypothetical protein P8X92_01665, partial [Dehalococcoidia bacterium]
MDETRGDDLRQSGGAFHVPRMRSWRVRIPMLPQQRTGSSLSRTLILGFAGLIVIGGILLMLPI